MRIGTANNKLFFFYLHVFADILVELKIYATLHEARKKAPDVYDEKFFITPNATAGVEEFRRLELQKELAVRIQNRENISGHA